jgi:hypothetical protein
VQPAPGAEPGPEPARELLEYTRARIAHYRCPRSVDFTDRLPRTSGARNTAAWIRMTGLLAETGEFIWPRSGTGSAACP